MINKSSAIDSNHIENFIKLNSGSFEVENVGEDSVKITMKMKKDMFNPEISRLLYDHGKEIFKNKSMSNYSDVNDKIERVVYFESKEEGIEFLIKDTTEAISEYAQSNEKRRGSFMNTSPEKDVRKSLLVKIVDRVRGNIEAAIDMY